MNKMPWFAFYPSDWIKGTRRLSPAEKGIWIDLLCYMWEAPERGKLETDWQELARMVGADYLEIEPIILSLVRKGLLDHETQMKRNETKCNGNETLICRRMYRDGLRSKSSTLRVREYRKRIGNGNETGDTHKSYSEVIKDKDLTTLSSDNDRQPLLIPEKPTGPTPEHLVKLWNSAAHVNLPRVQILTDKRKKLVSARLAQHPAREFWEGLIQRVNKCPLLIGENGNWRASFDWILNPNNMAKVIEGNYDATNGRH